MASDSKWADAQLRVRARIDLRISLIGVMGGLFAVVASGVDVLREPAADRLKFVLWLIFSVFFASRAYGAYRTIRKLR